MSDDLLDLLHTAPAPAMSVDPYAVIATARRRRLRRRVVRLVAAAAVVALAVGGWALLRMDDRPIPAGPRGDKATMKTIGTDATTTVPFSTIEASADPATGATTFTGVTKGRRVELGTVPAPGGSGRITVSTDGTPSILLGVLPAGAFEPDITSFVPTSAAPDFLAYWKGVETLPASHRVVFAVGFPTRADALKVRAIQWKDATGHVHFTGGSLVRSVSVFGPSGGTREIYVDEQLRVVGLLESSGDLGSSGVDGPTRSTLPASGAGLFSGTNGSSGAGSGMVTEVSLYGVLPRGAHRVGLVDARGHAVAVDVTTQPIAGTSYLGVYAEQRVTGDGTSLIEGVSAMRWTDTAGVEHTTARSDG